MENKKIAALIVIMIIFIFVVAGLMALSSHLPFIGKALALIFAIILIAGIVVIFVYAGRKGKK